MKKVITYGTFDLLHEGHVNILRRAKQLGDYLIVGVTSDDFDRKRGKINGQQSLMERIEAVRETGYADEIIVEEYDGQKIDDINRLGVDIFTVGSDWVGKFDYLKDFCEVVYLPRTEGISSSDLRKAENSLRVGIWGTPLFWKKYVRESRLVNGVEVIGLCSTELQSLDDRERVTNEFACVTADEDELLEQVDAVFLLTHPRNRYEQIKKALERSVHVLCESPIAMSRSESEELFKISDEKNVVLADGIKTAYSTAYARLLLAVKTGIIGRVLSVDSVCTSMHDNVLQSDSDISSKWNSITAWGPTALLPIFQLLGTEPKSKSLVSWFLDKQQKFDGFTKIDFVYDNAVASAKIAKAAKSEGELIVTGTKGYIYVPAPWWKTDYFEIRYEDPTENKRFFYKLDGEGIRYEILTFVQSIMRNTRRNEISRAVSIAIADIMGDFIEDKSIAIS